MHLPARQEPDQVAARRAAAHFDRRHPGRCLSELPKLRRNLATELFRAFDLRQLRERGGVSCVAQGCFGEVARERGEVERDPLGSTQREQAAQAFVQQVC
jgi:hypothetical protein